MSDIRANTISDASGNGPINLHKQSAAKAYAQCDAAGSISGSFNITSVVDANSLTVGRIDVNITSAMDGPVTGYGYTVSATCNGTSGSRFVTVNNQTSSNFQTYAWDGDVRLNLPIGVAVHGDLA